MNKLQSHAHFNEAAGLSAASGELTVTVTTQTHDLQAVLLKAVFILFRLAQICKLDAIAQPDFADACAQVQSRKPKCIK